MRERLEESYNKICDKDRSGQELTEFETNLRHEIYLKDRHWEMMDEMLNEQWKDQQEQEWYDSRFDINGEAIKLLNY